MREWLVWDVTRHQTGLLLGIDLHGIRVQVNQLQKVRCQRPQCIQRLGRLRRRLPSFLRICLEVVGERFSLLAGHHEGRVKRHLAQEGNGELFRQTLASRKLEALVRREDLRLTLARGAHKPTHVLHDPQHLNRRLLAEVEFAPDVGSSHLLRRRHDNGAVASAALLEVRHQREMLVRGAGRGVNEQHIEVAPRHVLQEVLDDAVLARTAEHDGIVLPRQQRLDGHERHVVVDGDGLPPVVALVHLLVARARQARHARPANVGVHDAHHQPQPAQRHPELLRERRLAHAALPAEDQDLLPDRRHALLDGGQVRVLSPARAGGAETGVRASFARRGLARLLALRAHAGLVGLRDVNLLAGHRVALSPSTKGHGAMKYRYCSFY
eukprot:Rhum_TRINITY_DN18668_c0_g1::Rhum_TRINITY_DN18668_c0_g1_i1::g.167903::m.167903